MARRPRGEMPKDPELDGLRYVTIVLNVEEDTFEVHYPGMSQYEALGLLKAAAADQESYVIGDDPQDA